MTRPHHHARIGSPPKSGKSRPPAVSHLGILRKGIAMTARVDRSAADLQAAVTYPPQVRVFDGAGRLLRVITSAELGKRAPIYEENDLPLYGHANPLLPVAITAMEAVRKARLLRRRKAGAKMITRICLCGTAFVSPARKKRVYCRPACGWAANDLRKRGPNARYLEVV